MAHDDTGAATSALTGSIWRLPFDPVDEPGDGLDQAEFWEMMGPAWARNADLIDVHQEPFGARALAALSPAPGERLLDIGCGCGATTLELAGRVGPEGSVAGVDLSEDMLAVARQRAAAAGLDHVTFRRADAQAADLAALGDGGPFDGAFSRMGVMFFPDPTAAFANVAAALAPGGRLSVAVWQSLEANPWMFVPTLAAAAHLGLPRSLPGPDDPGPFSLADADRACSLLVSAGFDRPSAQGVEVDVVLAGDPAGAERDASGLLQIGPMKVEWEEASPGARDAAAQAVVEAVAPYRRDGAYRIPAAAWVVTARLP